MNHRKVIAAFLVGLFLFVGVPFSAQAAEYYMSPSGSDSNPGTLAAPWKTLDRLQEAQRILRPGDTIYFRGGDYVTGYAANRAYYSWSTDGTASAPITYRRYQDEIPVIVLDRTSPRAGAGTLIFVGDYITIDGLNFKQTEASRSLTQRPDGSIVRNSGIGATALATWSTGVIIRNCSIDGFTLGVGAFGGRNILVEFCRVSGTVSHGFYIAAAGGTYRYNDLDGSRGYPNQQGMQVQYVKAQGNRIYGNVIRNGRATGVVFSGQVSNNEFFNNVIIGGPGASGMDTIWAVNFWCEDGPIGPGNKVYNNTVIGRFRGGMIMNGQCTVKDTGFLGRNVHFFDNVFSPGVQSRAGLLTSLIRNNIYHNITGSIPSGNTLIDPKLVNPNGNTAADAALLADSPARDAGTGSSFPRDDFEGKPRPAGASYDIGAFEGGYEGLRPIAPPPSGVPPAVARPPSTYNPDGKLCP